VHDGQAEQIGVGQLSVAEQFIGVEMADGDRIAGLRHDADAAVLREGAGRPAGSDVLRQARLGASVVQVPIVEPCDQHIDVEQRRAPNRLGRVAGTRLAHADESGGFSGSQSGCLRRDRGWFAFDGS
jgi:hypothetical protein